MKTICDAFVNLGRIRTRSERWWGIALLLTYLVTVAIGAASRDSGEGVEQAVFPVVVNGRPEAVLVLADEPAPMARYAAQEFQTHVKRATGVMLPVVHESDVPDDVPGQIHIVSLPWGISSRNGGWSTVKPILNGL